MSTTTVKVSIAPDASLIGKLGRRGKNLPETIAEIIDNSLDAFWVLPERFKSKSQLNVIIEATHEVLTIQDNGKGMSANELGRALVVGESSKEQNKSLIGSHGFGLKSAAMYLADELIIYTMHFNEPNKINILRFNRNEFEKRAKDIQRSEKNTAKAIDEIWKVEVSTVPASAVTTEAYFKDKRGTKIVLRHNGKYKPGSKEGIKNKLSKIFAPLLKKAPGSPPIKKEYLYDFEMSISWKKAGGGYEEILATGPFYTERRPHGSSKLTKYEKGSQKNEPAVLDFVKGITYIDIPKKRIDGKLIFGRAALLDRSQYHDGKFGFDLLKNGRVIEFNVLDPKVGQDERGNDAIFLRRSSDKARIVGQLFMDDWATDHQKTQFLRNDDSWNQLTEHIRNSIEPLFKLSASLQNAGASKEHSSKKNSMKAFHDFAENFSDKITKQVVSAFNSAQSKRIHKDFINTGSSKKSASTKKDLIESLNIVPSLQFVHKGKLGELRKYRLDKSEKKMVLHIDLNVDHPVFANGEVSHWNMMSKLIQLQCIAETVADILADDKTSIELYKQQLDVLLKQIK